MISAFFRNNDFDIDNDKHELIKHFEKNRMNVLIDFFVQAFQKSNLRDVTFINEIYFRQFSDYIIHF